MLYVMRREVTQGHLQRPGSPKRSRYVCATRDGPSDCDGKPTRLLLEPEVSDERKSSRSTVEVCADLHV